MGHLERVGPGSLAAVLAAGLLVLGLTPAGAAGPSHGRAGPPEGRPGAQRPTVKAGAASRSVLPQVDGSYGYLAGAELPDPSDPVSVGTFVEEWDAGRVAVGNGEDNSHWVHDDLRTRALALEELGGDGEITVMVAADLYMIFRTDGDEIRRKARALLPPGLARRVNIQIATTHNHHGPDTAFDVNHAWYDHMTDQVAATVAEAVRDRRPATLRVGDGRHWFGISDGRDPKVIDPTMNVLQATATNGETVATVVQWNNHPETTLGWEPPVERPEDCAALGEAPDCPQEGRYFTADYPGVIASTLTERYGGVTLYFNGAVGGMMTPLDAEVWEITDEVGLGDQLNPPDGATPAGGPGLDADDNAFDGENFRRAVVIGRQAALAAQRILDTAEVLDDPAIDYRERTFLTRFTHLGFRQLLVVDPDTGRTSLGHNPPTLYTCPPEGPATLATCEPDGQATATDPQIGPIRAGTHLPSAVGYLTIGPVGMAWIPGELLSELAVGLPAGFTDDPGQWFSGSQTRHAAGADYTMPGYLYNRMDDRYRWTVGLGNGEWGYIVPLSDWRIACVADAATCEDLHEAGHIAHPDAVSGTQCRAVTEDPGRLEAYPDAAAQVIADSCRYGQALGEADDHYEETNSAGWDMAADLLEAFGDLTGNHDPGVLNPTFPGHWRGMPPPVGAGS